MDNIFIVKSPLQIINSLEAIEYFKLNHNILVIIHDNDAQNTTQMNSLTSMYNWKKIIILESIKKFKFFRDVSFIKKLSKEQYNYMFLSNITSIHKLLLANIKRKKTFYIDDGIETISRYNNQFLPNKLNNYRVKQLRYLLTGLKIHIKDNINLFTYFDLKDFRTSKVIKNDLNHFKKKYLVDTKIDEHIYILGQPLVSLNFLKEEDYFKYLDYIISAYDNNIIYIPHRTEIISDRLKSYISDKFEIKDLHMPIELYFLQNNIYPSHIIGFITTAFFTLKKLYSKSNFSYIYISNNKILKNKKAIMDTYSMIETLNINKIKVDEEDEKN